MLVFTKEEIKALKRLDVASSEAQILEFVGKDGRAKIIKNFHTDDAPFIMTKIRTCKKLSENKDSLPENLCIPEDFMVLDGRPKGLVLPKVDGETLDDIIENESISLQKKKEYLIKLGEVLKRLSQVRKNSSLRDFYIGDLHASNCMIDNRDRVILVDLDSCKLGNNETPISKHLLGTGFIRGIKGKYSESKDKEHITEITSETDLFCYNMIILEFLLGRVGVIDSVEKFNNIIQILKSSGINQNIINAFLTLVSDRNNLNPMDYIDSITQEQREICKLKRKR